MLSLSPSGDQHQRYVRPTEPAPWSPTDHVLGVPVHVLDASEAYLAVLDGYPTAFAADERFAYCNGGYVVLALLAERAAGVPFADPRLARGGHARGPRRRRLVPQRARPGVRTDAHKS